MQTQLIQVGSGRTVNNGRSVVIGVQDDKGVGRIVYTGLPNFDPGQLVTLHWVLDNNAGDVVTLGQESGGYLWNIDDSITQYLKDKVLIGAYLRITVGDTVRWSSCPFWLRGCGLPDVDTIVEPPTVSAIDQMLQAIQAHQVDMAEQEQRIGDMVADGGRQLSAVTGLANQVAEDAQGVEADKNATHEYMVRAESTLDKLTNLNATAKTLLPGSDATVTKTTTPDGYALAFGIPRGDKGDKGEPGQKGDTGATGPQGPKGDTYDDSEVRASIDELKEDLSFFGSLDKPGEETLVTGKMVIPSGILITQESSDAHTNIRVTRGTRIEISNAYCAYSRSICAYDKDGNFVKVLGTNLGEVNVTVEYDVDDYDSISVTSKTGESITVRYVAGQSAIPAEGYTSRIDEKNATKDGTGNYIAAPEIQLDQSAFTDGYLSGNGVYENSYCYYSDFIPVIEEQGIKLNNIFVGGFTIAVFYDSDKEYLTHIRHESTSHEISTTVTVPYNAKYMRFTADKSRDFSTISVKYAPDKIDRNFKPLNLVNRWYSDSKGRINTLFAKATSKPICCIIDDDSPSAADMETFAALMEENGISGTIACLTGIMDNNEDLKTKLLELERRGHQVVLHGYTQNEAYKNASVIGDANYKVAENDFVHGLRDLMTAGFVDCKFWVTPYGVSQDCLKNLARKWGIECLVTTAKKEYNGSDGKFSRYEIQRSGLNANDTGTLTQEQLLALADQCADANGWLLINTHITDGWNGDFTRITDFITHCKEKGFEFMTLGDAWRIRKPIYEWYETF